MIENSFSHEMDNLGKQGTPFLFVIDFLARSPLIIPLDQVDANKIRYNINGITNVDPAPEQEEAAVQFGYEMPDRERYRQAYEKVQYHLHRGDSYLLNLTMPVNISTNLDLEQIYNRSNARYRLWIKDKFTVFSPEPFVRIVNGKIFSYPMKGTIPTEIPDARNKLLTDEKELAEHYTIVDLIRNDLNMVAEKVRVDKFRYVEQINTIRGPLLQTSSLISGMLPAAYPAEIGSIMQKLLPAGSVTGAPKRKTVEIILDTEQYDRGYYTGVFGYFDGQNMDCGVMIRFVEQQAGKLVFKAGGGITVKSDAGEEFKELLSKVYLPFGPGKK